MKKSHAFLSQVLDSITEHIVVINNAGEIQFVNKTWTAFGKENACMIGDDWSGINYLEECDKASAMKDDFGTKAGKGIRSVIEDQEEMFYLEYPCHSPEELRWFMMRVTSFQSAGKDYFVISHQNITERKLVEEKVKNLAKIDGLTKIPNRRTFDAFLHDEWRRCLRLKKPISLAIVDLDHFKLLNDTYGHQSGDECLIKVGEVLKEFVNRPTDICARYGGEEFALLWGNTSLEQAKGISNRVLKKIIDLKIENNKSPTQSYLTASIGLAEMIPSIGSEEKGIIRIADSMLYKAKENGRNRIMG